MIGVPATIQLEPNTTLEQLLNALQRYGEVNLSFLGDGWYCRVSMFVSSKGAEFKVASEFKLPTHNIAARQCYERIQQTLKDLSA